MKCKACKYERSFDIAKEEFTSAKEFISINGNFTIDNDNGFISRIRLYACPKCFTVILERY